MQIHDRPRVVGDDVGGQFSRKNPRATPPEAENDASVVGLITGAYQGGLQNLKKLME